MGKTIAQYKKDIQFKGRLKKDPLSVIQDMMREGVKDKSVADVLVLEKYLPEILREFVQNLSDNPEFLELVAASVAKKIPKPKDGKNADAKGILKYLLDNFPPATQGERGEQGNKGEAGRDGKDGKDGRDGKNGKDGSPDTAEQIVKKINDMPDDAPKIDASRIKNLPEPVKEPVELKRNIGAGQGLQRGGLKLVWNTELDGTINGVNTIFTVPASKPTPQDGKFLVAVRGVAKDSDNGDFTVSNNNRTITFTDAPPTGSARPRIILYHGH